MKGQCSQFFKAVNKRRNIHKTPLVSSRLQNTETPTEMESRTQDYPRGNEAQKEKREKNETRPFLCPQLQLSKKTSTPQSLVNDVLKGYLETAKRQRFKSAPQFVVERCPEGTLKKKGTSFLNLLHNSLLNAIHLVHGPLSRLRLFAANSNMI